MARYFRILSVFLFVAVVRTLPAQSLASTTIYYSRTNGTIWRASADGTADVPITAGEWPRVSPNGVYLLFRRGPGWGPAPSQQNVYLRNLLNGQETLLFNNNDYVVSYDWTADSNQILLDYQCGIYWMSRDGSSGLQTLFYVNCYDDAPAVNRVDGRFAFHNTQGGGGIGWALPDGSNRHIVPNTGPTDVWPAWSADGRWISFLNGKNFFKIRPDGTGRTQLTFLTNATDTFDPIGAWTGDGARIITAGISNGTNGLFAVATDGSGLMVTLPVNAATNFVVVGSVFSPTPSSAPAPSGLLSWWPASGNAIDVRGGNNGLLLNGTGFAEGLVGQAFGFDGIDDVVVVSNAPNLNFNGTTPMSVELWVYRTNNSVPQHILGKRAGCGVGGIQYQLAFDGSAFDFCSDSGGVTTPSQLPLNVWKHIAATFDGVRGILYVDGQPVATNNSFSLGPVTAAPLKIGGSGSCATFGGLLDEVSFYNRALSPAEVQSIFASGSFGKASLTVPPSTGFSVPYFTDFESGVGPEWASPVLDSSYPATFTKFTGRFGNNAQSLTLTNLVVGQSYTVGFDLYIIDTWDGAGGPDYFNVLVNGFNLFHETFSNYNQDPPNQPQSYLGQPDSGRVDMGFASGYVDAIYRNVEVTFIASNATAQITFQGENLEGLSNESWGLDNVGVKLTSSLAPGTIRSSSLPLSGSTNILAIDHISLVASRDLNASTATNSANYSLRFAGANGVFGDGDDLAYALTAQFSGLRFVTVTFTNNPLQAGLYRIIGKSDGHKPESA